MDGKQYIIVAVSGGNYSGDYIAYSLPRELGLKRDRPLIRRPVASLPVKNKTFTFFSVGVFFAIWAFVP